MKKYLKTYPEVCIACHMCESVCSNLYFKEDDASKSCIQISESASGNGINVCNQCQICVQACPTQALTVNHQGVVMLNKSLCINCYMCIGVCPTDSMQRYKGGITPFKCISCGACAKTCPVEAIKIVQE